MKKKWMILIFAILGIAGVMLASQVDAWVSAPCPYCGATNAIHITNGDCSQGIERTSCKKCSKHFSVRWERKGNGQVVVTDIMK